MRPLHVLLLNEYFPPDTAATAKNAALVAEAIAERHYVTVLAGRPSYDPTERHPPVSMAATNGRGTLRLSEWAPRPFPDFE